MHAAEIGVLSYFWRQNDVQYHINKYTVSQGSVATRLSQIFRVKNVCKLISRQLVNTSYLFDKKW